MPTDYGQFLQRYNHLKYLYFSPKANARVDEDGEELTNCHPNRGQIAEMFEKMGLQVPTHRQDPPTLRNGTVLPNHVPENG